MDRTLEELQQNIEVIYAKEMKEGVIKSIEVLQNEEGIQRGKRIKSSKPHHEVKNSVCVLITSYPGASLNDVSLM